MKGSYKYILFITVFVVLCFALGQRMPRKFEWMPTFVHTDRQPFGCFVFDSIMKETMPRGYTVSRKTFSQIGNDSALHRNNVLVVCDVLNLTPIDLRSLDRLMRQGSHVMIAVTQSAHEQTDSTLAHDYGLAYEGSAYFQVQDIRRFLRGNDCYEHYDTIFWHKGSAASAQYPPMQAVTFHSVACGEAIVDRRLCSEVKFDTLLWKFDATTTPQAQSPYFHYWTEREKEMARKHKLKEYNDNAEWLGPCLDEQVTVKSPIAVTRPVGQGRLTIVVMSFAMTNYGVLDRQLSPMVMRLMTQIADRPVIRTTAYMKTAAEYEAELSPMRYVLSQKPLRHAWYLTLLTLALFCVFKARRRQRVIPVMNSPKNHSLEFARLIGTLYFQRGDNADLVRKKFVFMAERLRTTLQTDVLSNQLPPDAASLIARRTGLDERQVDEALKRLRLDYWTEGKLNDREMKWAIDTMDKIMKRI